MARRSIDPLAKHIRAAGNEAIGAWARMVWFALEHEPGRIDAEMARSLAGGGRTAEQVIGRLLTAKLLKADGTDYVLLEAAPAKALTRGVVKDPVKQAAGHVGGVASGIARSTERSRIEANGEAPEEANSEAKREAGEEANREANEADTKQNSSGIEAGTPPPLPLPPQSPPTPAPPPVPSLRAGATREGTQPDAVAFDANDLRSIWDATDMGPGKVDLDADGFYESEKLAKKLAATARARREDVIVFASRVLAAWPEMLADWATRDRATKGRGPKALNEKFTAVVEWADGGGRVSQAGPEGGGRRVAAQVRGRHAASTENPPATGIMKGF